ncbi:dihydrodipicolinate synthase family protein [Nocardia sp. NBC_00565]|uniref:dihydrodipicolinate synthase family protein n=1 Tax=Nocardia sp. NBC_00565 TaxID=2975993 RepID=UPI002E8045D8|nr:dihydrodipicolinate synthase family protein [Nocardia sp. NBC_00565]WUC05602.1 dihydrodipicolinate synthase family protein [Nocardia sp. NBC_00565]
MVKAKEAKEWAHESLRGNCSSLYTPFSGLDGDDIDYDALRALVRHCLVHLDQDGLWLTGGIAEFWSLTTEELKEVMRVTIEEARRVKPDALIQVMSSSDTAKQTVELTLHAQRLGADICYILTPYFECAGKPGVLEFLRYVADRTDMPLGYFNSQTTGLAMTPSECVELYREIPALCGLKNGLADAHHSLAIHRLEPGMVLWEANDEAGIRLGVPHPGALGAALYLYEKPGMKLYTEWRELLVQRDFERAEKFAEETGLAAMRAASRRYQAHPARPRTFTHWGAGFKFGASLLGLPIGDYPHSRPPQTAFPADLQAPIRRAYTKSGFIES